MDHDPQCAMAHWGIAMTYFHQLWEPPILPVYNSAAQREIRQGLSIGAGTERERNFLHAAGLIFQDAASVPYHTRALQYEQAMGDLASDNSQDVRRRLSPQIG
jgi:hypothetical protein